MRFFGLFSILVYHLHLTLGGVWPPASITVIPTMGIPLTNTFLLLSSGFTVTWAHHAILVRAKRQALIGLMFTIMLACIFTGLQVVEYY